MSAELSNRPPPILVAEDDPSIGRLLVTLLQRAGFDAHLAHDGESAIAAIRENDYAVILLDLNMPGVDGFGVLDFLRASNGQLRPIVLIMTAFDDRIVEALDPSVVSGVLRKPFEVSTIASRVAECVAAYEGMAREAEQQKDKPAIVPPQGRPQSRTGK